MLLNGDSGGHLKLNSSLIRITLGNLDRAEAAVSGQFGFVYFVLFICLHIALHLLSTIGTTTAINHINTSHPELDKQ